jgi:hypothetical protein
MVIGVDQVLLYGWRYTLIAALITLHFGILFAQLQNRSKVATSIPAQIYGLTAVAIVLVPTSLRSSERDAWAGLIAERLSLVVGVLLLELLGRARPSRWQLGAGIAACMLFFAMLHVDLRKAVLIEARMEALVRTLPPGQRFIAFVKDLEGSERESAATPGPTLIGKVTGFCERHPSNGISLAHLLSRACIGRCFDYQNYEAATGQFRIRARSGNAFVVADIATAYGMEQGWYVMKPNDPDLHVIYRCGQQPSSLCMRRLHPGERTRGLQTRTD